MPAQLLAVNATRNAEREEARARAWEMRLAGRPPAEIARELSVSVGTAAAYLRETLDELRQTSMDGADAWRRLQLARLDGMIAHWLPISRDPMHLECARGAAIVLRGIELQCKLAGLLGSNVILPPNGQPGLADMDSIKQAVASSPAMLSGLKRMLDDIETTKKPDPKRIEQVGKPG